MTDRFFDLDVRGTTIRFIDRGEHVAWWVDQMRRGIWEEDTLDAFDKYATGGTILDIGAWCGLFSIYAAKKYDCQVVAFEPDPIARWMLAKNIAANDIGKRVEVVPAAVWTHDGYLTLRVESELGDSMTGISREGRPYRAKAISVARIAATWPDTMFAKIDIEGAEAVVWPEFHSYFPNVPVHLSWHLFESGLGDHPELLPDYPQVGGLWCYPTYMVVP